MGEEIGKSDFSEADFDTFKSRLARETSLLRQLQTEDGLSDVGPLIGLELEAWLIDHNFYPAPHNQSFLERLASESVVAELSRFNIEINTPVEEIAGEGLGRMHAHLSETMRQCASNAHDDVDTVVAIGTLPTLREEDLSLDMMTPSNRYAALNKEAMRQRKGALVSIDIDDCGDGEGFAASYEDVMAEAATTSLQLHLQLADEKMCAAYNASLLLSAPLVAISANSPFLFGQPLWHETRIPIFEQALAQPTKLQRVTFGTGYAQDHLVELFEENLRDYPVMLPMCNDGKSDEDFACLKLHNGTLWRWVRPLVGRSSDGKPHIRIEQRVMAAGPSVLDMMANAALYFGAVEELSNYVDAAMAQLPFETARDSFYAAARNGLGAEIAWFGKRSPRPVVSVLADLIPMAERGLRSLGMAESLIDKYLSTIAIRLESRQNGANWQRAHFKRYGDFHRLTADYLANQKSGLPVHEWAL
jgi:gamma-glutamyl:cysteine ligase YbdK (ATP-grasp superfamily)